MLLTFGSFGAYCGVLGFELASALFDFSYLLFYTTWSI
jgi:hypothetical protein